MYVILKKCQHNYNRVDVRFDGFKFSPVSSVLIESDRIAFFSSTVWLATNRKTQKQWSAQESAKVTTSKRSIHVCFQLGRRSPSFSLSVRHIGHFPDISHTGAARKVGTPSCSSRTSATPETSPCCKKGQGAVCMSKLKVRIIPKLIMLIQTCL